MAAKQRKPVPRFFAVIWTLSVIFFDLGIGYRLFLNLWTYTYANTPGKVASTRLEEQKGSKGSVMYLPHVEYDYEIGGRSYHGKSRRGVEAAVGGNGVKARMQKILDQYPVGRAVTVYYDRTNPDRAVLETGLDGMDLFMVMLLVPFNVVVLILWKGGATATKFPAEVSYLDYVEETEKGWRMTLVPNASRSTFLYWLGGLSFAGIFIVAIALSGMPSQTAMLIVWGIVLVAAKLLGRMTFGSEQRLEIQEGNRSFQLVDLPGSFPIEAKDIQSIKVLPAHSSPDSPDGSQTSYQVGVEFLDDEEEGAAKECEVRFLTGATREQAIEVARWVKEKLALPESKLIVEQPV